MSSIRTGMIDNDELFTGKYYKRNKKTKKINTDTDIPSFFKFSYPEGKGKTSEDTQVIPGRRNTSTSVIIETESLLDFKPDEKIAIGSDIYNITKIPPINNPSYDLKAVRGFNNVSKIMVLDK